jgi:hypothetical protein
MDWEELGVGFDKGWFIAESNRGPPAALWK